jgi:ornithine carbamoyltransferase
MLNKTKHMISGEELASFEIKKLIENALVIKKNKLSYSKILENYSLALLFEKPSFRTRLSFTAAMLELGGQVMCIDSSILYKDEWPQDQIRVLQGYCQVLMLRTFTEQVFEQMLPYAKIPIINGLSNLYHPCQILADLLTLYEIFSDLKGLKICYIGDGNNVLHSLLLIAPKLGISIHYCCPKDHQPNPEILKKAITQETKELIQSFVNPQAAVNNVDAIYTDVWTSMGFPEINEEKFSGFQLNTNLLNYAKKDTLIMHCMPMNRGREIETTLPEHKNAIIFQQSENRLHAQKALLLTLLKGESYDC